MCQVYIELHITTCFKNFVYQFSINPDIQNYVNIHLDSTVKSAISHVHLQAFL